MIAGFPRILALGGEDLLPHVLPHRIHAEPLFTVAGYDVYFTNHMLMMTLATLAAMWVLWVVAKRIGAEGPADQTDTFLTQGRLSQVVEVILIYLREEMTRPALGKLTDKYIGYIWTTFFFILFCNLLGMVPWGYGIQSVLWLTGGDPHAHSYQFWGHLQGTATGNLAVTGALALVAMFMITFVGLRHNGMGYIAHHAPVPVWPIMKGASPAMLPVAFLLVLLEIMGAFIKPFALCMRLFANMLAGHLVLGALIGLIFVAESYAVRGVIVVPSVLGALALSMLELFVAFLQAYIFAFLTVLFIAQGAVHHGDDHHEHEPHDAELGTAHGTAESDPEVAAL